MGELHAEEEVGLLTVTAAREEAADAPKAVRYKDRAGDRRYYLIELCLVAAAEDKVEREEYHDTADKSADERDAASKLKAALGIFDIIVGRLKESRREKSERDRCNSVVEDEICKSLLDALLL